MLYNVFCAVRRFIRSSVPFLLGTLLVLAYYQYNTHQTLQRAKLAAAVDAHQLNADSPEVAEAHLRAVVPLGNAGGKGVIALAIFFIGLAAVWLTLRFVVPVLPNWAKGKYADDPQVPAVDFKLTFLHLPFQWQILLFCAVWLALLFYFSLCWLGASLVQ